MSSYLARKFSHHTAGTRYSVHFGWPEGVLLPLGRYKLAHTKHSRVMLDRYVWKDNIGKKGKARLPCIKMPEWVVVTEDNLVEIVVSNDFRSTVLNFLVTLPYDKKDDLCLAIDVWGNVLTVYLRDIERRGQAPKGASYDRLEKEEEDGE